ncbi:MAG: hypothetical protein M1836_006460 [Candelina mexicana]|nr:MAG: hypothetical protein M1836_006460 [Candelina mexicana]
MNDSQAILYLLPFTDAATEALSFPENSERVVRVSQLAPSQEVVDGASDVVDGHHRQASGLQDAADVTSENTPSNHEYDDVCAQQGRGLRIGFDDDFGESGIVFGRQQSSDVLLVRNNVTGISRQQFRIHFNLESGVLMLTDTSKYGTVVGRGERLVKRSFPLMTNTTIYCGLGNCIGFDVRIHDYSKDPELWRNHFDSYRTRLGVDPSKYIPTPGVTPWLRPIGRNYSVLEPVGRGYFGLVHTAVQNRDGRIFAAKQLSCREARGQPVVPREVEIFSQISHPNIVPFVDAIYSTPDLFILMEYQPGGKLLAYQDSRPRQRFQPGLVRSVLNQALDALVYLHMHSITHRDIKPENILVACHDPFWIMLADFGLSSQSKDPKSFCGTPPFLAPEVYQAGLSKGTIYDSRVDIWGLGAVAYKGLGGLPKHQGGGVQNMKSAQSQYYQDIERSLTSRRQTPIVRLLRNMLAEDPQQRPSAKECLEDPWLRCERQTINRLQMPKRALSSSPAHEEPSRRRRIDEESSRSDVKPPRIDEQSSSNDSANASNLPVTYPSEGVYHLRLPSH